MRLSTGCTQERKLEAKNESESEEHPPQRRYVPRDERERLIPMIWPNIGEITQ